MKLDCVLSAVNENPLYLDFVPIFIKTWKKLYPHINVKIVMVMDEIPETLKCYEHHFILFKPLNDVLTSYTSQIIRLFYPCLMNYENGVMITDIDMLPMNRTYYTEPIKDLPDDRFIYFRETVCFRENQLAMCYNIATPSVWSDVFNIKTIDELRNTIQLISEHTTIKEGHGNTGWCTDQCFLFKKIMEWNQRTHKLVCLKESFTKFRRLDRLTKCLDLNKENRDKIKSGFYTDYHCYRPMSKYEKTNYEVFDLL